MTLSVPSQFTIQIKMTSDWHVGSGSGHGEIDSAVQRDSDGLPYIPAKTLTGILRDSCEQVALALDSGNEQGKFQRWINFLFGDQPALAEGAVESEPRPAVVGIRSAYFSKELKEALSTQALETALKQAEQFNSSNEIAENLKLKRQLKNAIAFIKPGVAIDPDTGSAKPDYLRFEEVVRMGAVLEAPNCILDFTHAKNPGDDYKKTAYALLIAGAKLCERLGGKRRRGNGNCTITVNDGDIDPWIKWLQQNHQAIGDPPEFQAEKLHQSPVYSVQADSTWYSIPLTLTTLSPVILPSRTVGNVVECLDYIPGRYLLRHLHRTLGNKININQAIARSDLIITNATIAIDEIPGRPTPFCLFAEKLDGGLSKGKGVYNRFQEAEPDHIQLKGERGGYLGTLSGTELPEYKTISHELYTHNTIQDDVQRPTSDVGGVYSYQAIPPGTILKAELRFPESIKKHLDQLDKDWWKNLHSNIRIGQSKKDQYGSLKVGAKKPKQMQSSNPMGNDQRLYLWFLSDVLLRDERLNPTTNPDLLKRELEKQLGVRLLDPVSEEYLSFMARSRRTDSWQVRWGLPRPSLLGWQAGTCMVYEVNGDIKPDQLTELAAKGIGERTAEGYGQISFNDPLLIARLSTLERNESSPNPDYFDFQPIPRSDLSFNYARTIEIAAWREVIRNRVIAIAANPNQRQEVLGLKIQGEISYPSMSQLGGVRSTLRRLQSLGDQDKVTSWLNALESVDNRKEKWNETERGLDKIRELVTDPGKIWRILSLGYNNLVITSGGRNELQQILWAEAVRTLVDAIIRGHKRDFEKVESREAA